MHRLQSHSAQRRCSGRATHVVLALATCLVSWLTTSESTAQSAARAGCADWRVEFIAIEGTVEFRPAGEVEWQQAQPGDLACRGDGVRAGPFAGATLRLPDRTVFRLDENTQLELPGPDDGNRTWIDLLRGIIHIISRDPRELNFRTPYLNAGLEGTEFVLAVDESGAEVTVIEGIVSVADGQRRIEVPQGQRGRAAPGAPPAASSVADPFDATRWTPYSARILLADYTGDLPAASAEDAAALVRRAGWRIERGAFDAASADLATAARANADEPGIAALRAMVALSRGDKARAAELAARSVAVSPSYAPGHLATSYVAQASFDYESAYAAAARAEALAPASAVTVARRAELAIATGRYREAQSGARRAVTLEPGFANAHAIAGFAQLSLGAIDSAIASFEESVRLDATSPLPRIGWALAAFRRGEFQTGRDQLELAVILDPANAALRSLMAKVYAEEDRIELARVQLDLAAALDPADPTALLYRAITERRASRPVAALQAFDRAETLNDGAPAFRSQLRIDADTAVRDFGFGEVYRDLGFRDLALQSAWRATATTPLDHSAHRLLSDAYALLPRHELARVNEHYRARLLQPLSQNPVPPQLGEPSVYLLDDLGPRELAATDFVGLLPENGLNLQASAVGAGLDTRGYDLAITGLRDRLAYGFGHFDFATDGFRANNDLSIEVSSAHVQYQPTPVTSLIAELRHSSSDQGDLQLLFDPTKFSESLRQSEEIDSLRVGVRHDFDVGTLLTSTTLSTASLGVEVPPVYALSGESDAASLELQYLVPIGSWQLTTGIYRLLQEDRAEQMPALPLTGLDRPRKSDEVSAYIYGRVKLTERLQATIGLAADRIDFDEAEIHETNPKLGLRFDITDRTTLRTAVTDTTQGRIFSRRSIQPRLEPTHVQGFNQLFTGGRGERARRAGVAIDHRFSDTLFGGIEISARDVEFTTTAIDIVRGTSYLDFSDRDEQARHAYVHWLPADRVSVSAAYRRDRFLVEGNSLPESFRTLDTRRLPIEINYFAGNRLSAGARLSLIRQSGLFTEEGFGNSLNAVPDEDQFAVLDLSLAYRLPNELGQVSLSIDNALDERFRFQDIDPENPNVITERVVALRFTVAQ